MKLHKSETKDHIAKAVNPGLKLKLRRDQIALNQKFRVN